MVKRQQLLIDKWVLRKRISEERRTWNDDEQPGSLFSGVKAFPTNLYFCNILGLELMIGYIDICLCEVHIYLYILTCMCIFVFAYPRVGGTLSLLEV